MAQTGPKGEARDRAQRGGEGRGRRPEGDKTCIRGRETQHRGPRGAPDAASLQGRAFCGSGGDLRQLLQATGGCTRGLPQSLQLSVGEVVVRQAEEAQTRVLAKFREELTANLSAQATGLQPVRETRGFPGGSDGRGPACQCRRPRFNPWVGKMPWRRRWQPTPVFLPGESSGTEEPGGLQSTGSGRIGHDRSDLAHMLHPHAFSPFATLLIRFLHVDPSPPSEPSDPLELSEQTWNTATHHRYLRLQAECLSILNTPMHTAASRQLELRSR